MLKLRIETLYIALIILAANEFLNFGWWWHVQGKFNIVDIGNALIWVGVGALLFRKRLQQVPNSRLSILVFLYLIFVVIQIALAALHYDQPLVKGLIATRHQFYYASFFLFLLVLDTTDKIRTTLNMITLIAIIAILLGTINYFGPTILDHKWAEGHRIRSGIVRSYIPGMPIVSFAAIWEFSKLISKSQNINISGFWTFVLIAGHFFRQSRMRLIGVVAIILGMLILKRKFNLFLISIVIAVSGFVFLEYWLPENIISTPFVTATQNISEGTGSWRGRLVQLKIDFEEFFKHPLIGSGATSLRVDLGSVKTERDKELWALAYKSDLGYTHWLKAYGIIGMVWLILFFSSLWINAWKANRKVDDENRDIAFFLTGYVMFLVVTFMTLNHLMFPRSIVLVSLLAAMIVRINYLAERSILSKNKSSQSENPVTDSVI